MEVQNIGFPDFSVPHCSLVYQCHHYLELWHQNNYNIHQLKFNPKVAIKMIAAFNTKQPATGRKLQHHKYLQPDRVTTYFGTCRYFSLCIMHFAFFHSMASMTILEKDQLPWCPLCNSCCSGSFKHCQLQNFNKIGSINAWQILKDMCMLVVCYSNPHLGGCILQDHGNIPHDNVFIQLL